MNIDKIQKLIAFYNQTNSDTLSVVSEPYTDTNRNMSGWQIVVKRGAEVLFLLIWGGTEEGCLTRLQDELLYRAFVEIAKGVYKPIS
jgi:hypothetical protein